MSKFRVGSRVQFTGRSYHVIRRGMTAIVLLDDGSSLAVEFDNPEFHGHDVGGLAKHDRGWWMSSRRHEFRLLSQTPFQEEVRRYIEKELNGA